MTSLAGSSAETSYPATTAGFVQDKSYGCQSQEVFFFNAGIPEIESRYSFPAREYGYGWSFPVKWQGWVVLVVYFLLLLGGVQLFDPEVRIFEYIAFVAFISSILIGVSRARGESPPLALGQTVLKLAHLARCCC